MAGYRGDGYGVYGDHGDDDFRFGDDRGRDRDIRGERDRGRPEERGFFERDRDDDGPRQGATHGNVMGRAEQAVRSYVEGGDHGSGRGHQLSDDPRAVRAAGDWNRQHGREGYEGSYAQHPDPYQSYRERHLAEMDRDYDDWCRQREQQFHSEFKDWRSRRQMSSGQVGQVQSQMSSQQGDMPALELSDAAHATAPDVPVTAEQPSRAGSGASRRRGSSGSTPDETAGQTGGQQDR
ncbi:hypothetical protein OMW55_10795 [Sphingomonas sp. BN140010]|uniref:SWFGD domain-containing protein n=1 Tax=Sphingomonas arvum TaxID=2992113 RepID=A0ABT3JH60_9SPHN|nr:hypothetical protein [Sphingomonas sp. BN140010]MCW3798289.1 hypothetical protein [Sphingomonas sp. BN140010]